MLSVGDTGVILAPEPPGGAPALHVPLNPAQFDCPTPAPTWLRISDCSGASGGHTWVPLPRRALRAPHSAGPAIISSGGWREVPVCVAGSPSQVGARHGSARVVDEASLGGPPLSSPSPGPSSRSGPGPLEAYLPWKAARPSSRFRQPVSAVTVPLTDVGVAAAGLPVGRPPAAAFLSPEPFPSLTGTRGGAPSHTSAPARPHSAVGGLASAATASSERRRAHGVVLARESPSGRGGRQRPADATARDTHRARAVVMQRGAWTRLCAGNAR